MKYLRKPATPGAAVAAVAESQSGSAPTVRRMLQRLVLFCVGALAIFAGTAVAATPANASASGCTAAPSGYVCAGVDGSHKYISHMYVVRGKGSYDFICDYQGLFTLYDRYGNWLLQVRTSRHSGCTVGRAWFDWYPKANYPNAAKACAGFYERDVRQGMACIKLH